MRLLTAARGQRAQRERLRTPRHGHEKGREEEEEGGGRRERLFDRYASIFFVA